MTSRRDGDLDGLVNQLDRRHTDRAAGAVYERDPARQQFINAEFDDGVSLAAADFHHRPRPGRDFGDGAHERFGRLRVAVFVNEFHIVVSLSSSSSSIERKYSKTRIASSSSTTLMAKPT